MQQESKQKRLSRILGLGILLVLVFSGGLIVGRTVDKDINLPYLKASRDLDMTLFWDVLDITKGSYVDVEDIDDQELVYGAIKGMVNSIGDPATVFLTPVETEEFELVSEGKYFEGIGAELGYENSQIIVVSPLEGSPAKEAGIRRGDYILKVDDYELTVNDTVYDAVAKIRGEAGTKVTLTVLHLGESELKEITITRKEITVPSITLEYVGDNDEIAHLKVGRFTEATYLEWVKKWREQVEKIKASGVSKMILDLRGNPGGFFDAAIYAADDFLGEGFVISKQSDSKGNIKDFKSSKDGILEDIEVIVLVNSGSASASEILAGALQHSSRAQILGETTFGKGTAQKTLDLKGGSSLHVTILKWLLPDGTQIERDNSVVPDIEVELTNEDFVKGIDPQLEKAVEILSN
ncbi:MAG: S41 family peptidase [Candidatus Dojkabacteria bacterium]